MRAAWRAAAVVAVALPLAVAAAPAEQIRVGDRLPDLVLRDWHGQPVALTQVAAPVVIIEFWASWCASCRETLPALQALADRYRDSGVRLLAINIDRDRAAADRFLGRILEAPLSITVLADPEGVAMARFGAPGMPAVYVAEHGVVRLVESGYSLEKLAAIQGVVAAVNAAPEPGPSATP